MSDRNSTDYDTDYEDEDATWRLEQPIKGLNQIRQQPDDLDNPLLMFTPEGEIIPPLQAEVEYTPPPYYIEPAYAPPNAAPGLRGERPGRSRSGLVLYLLLGVAGLVTVALVAFGIILINNSSPKASGATSNLNAILLSTATPLPTIRVAPTAIPLPTITVAPTATPLPATTATQTDTERIFNLGKAAYDSQQWEDAIAAFDKLAIGDNYYNLARPLLVTAYANLGDDLVSKGENNLESALKTLEMYRKVQSLDPNYSALENRLHKADLYHQGRGQYEAQQCEEAINNLSNLYNLIKQADLQAKYRDTAELFYNCLILLGDKLVADKNLEEAKAKYQQAVNLDVPDKSVAQGKVAEVDLKLKPPPPVVINTPRTNPNTGGGGVKTVVVATAAPTTPPPMPNTTTTQTPPPPTTKVPVVIIEIPGKPPTTGR